jgi:hypothetical protein
MVHPALPSTCCYKMLLMTITMGWRTDIPGWSRSSLDGCRVVIECTNKWPPYVQLRAPLAADRSEGVRDVEGITRDLGPFTGCVGQALHEKTTTSFT